MMASTADQAAAKTVDMVIITSLAPTSPKVLRRPTNCSIPYLTDGRQGASATANTLTP